MSKKYLILHFYQFLEVSLILINFLIFVSYFHYSLLFHCHLFLLVNWSYFSLHSSYSRSQNLPFYIPIPIFVPFILNVQPFFHFLKSLYQRNWKEFFPDGYFQVHSYLCMQKLAILCYSDFFMDLWKIIISPDSSKIIRWEC
jgi:hypothetical protein